MHTHHTGHCIPGSLISIPTLSTFLNAALVTQPVDLTQILDVAKVSQTEY